MKSPYNEHMDKQTNPQAAKATLCPLRKILVLPLNTAPEAQQWGDSLSYNKAPEIKAHTAWAAPTRRAK